MLKKALWLFVAAIVAPAQAGVSRTYLEKQAELVAHKHGIPGKTLKAICARESSWNPNAVGPVGEIGLCQLRPTTVASMKGKDWRADLSEAERLKLIEKELFEPRTNLHWAARYIKMMIKEADGDVTLAIAAYNAGPGIIRYVKRVRTSIAEFEEAERVPLARLETAGAF